MGNEREAYRARNKKDSRTRTSKGKRRPKAKRVAITTDNNTPVCDENVSPVVVPEEPGPSSTPILIASEKKIMLSRKGKERILKESGNLENKITLSERYDESTDGNNYDEFSDDDHEVFHEEDIVDVEKNGYLLIDSELLLPLFDELIKCERCGFRIKSTLKLEQKQGLAHLIELSCRSMSCKWTHLFHTSKTV